MSTTLRADIEATVKEWRKEADACRRASSKLLARQGRPGFTQEATEERIRGFGLDKCADTLERLVSQHTGEGQVTDAFGTLPADVLILADALSRTSGLGYHEERAEEILKLIALSVASQPQKGQVTDEQVERACEVHWAKKHPKEEPWEMVAFDSPLWANDRRHLMRLAIEAALSAASPVQGEKK